MTMADMTMADMTMTDMTMADMTMAYLFSSPGRYVLVVFDTLTVLYYFTIRQFTLSRHQRGK